VHGIPQGLLCHLLGTMNHLIQQVKNIGRTKANKLGGLSGLHVAIKK